MKIGFAQINPTVGDLRGNFEKIASAYDQLARAGADIVIAPELAVTGYPPQDLVFKSRFVPENLAVLDQLQKRLNKTALLVGFVDRNEGRGKPFHNSAALLQAGEPLQKTHKSLLPTYDVFDEDRYFEPAREIAPLKFRGHRIGVTICEDIWTERYLPRPFYDVDPVRALVAQEAEMILNVSASPFSLRKPAVRREMISGLAGTYQRPIFYCNAVGGNDQLVFDGNSIAVNARGQLLAQLPAFEEVSVIVDSESVPGPEIPSADIVQELYSALRLGLRDYLAKCGFRSAVLGLSGGIDSAVVAAIAVDVPKTMIYGLARFINSEASRAGKGEIIPASTMEKPPSAELRPNQKDQDTLPPYDVLDAILRLYVEDNLGVAEIVAQGFDEKTVRWVQRRVDLNEYKRAQAAPGLKVTSRAFGVGRRMPIAQRYVG